MRPIDTLNELGQSLWYDHVDRQSLRNGELAALIDRGEIKGVTSNPTIFSKAISDATEYRDDLRSLARTSRSPEEIYEALVVSDIQDGCDLFAPLYRATDGGDGYVSLEVSPLLAKDTLATVENARRLWRLVDRPNLMIKIPGTKEGLPAIVQTIADGININVTLIFSLDQFEDVMLAFQMGLSRRLAAGEPIHHVASVASFFISRIDTLVDARLRDRVKNGELSSEREAALLGRAAVASAKLAYALHQRFFESERWGKLAAQGGRVQRPLWASTGTKDPRYPDTKYVDELIGPGTVNTVPPKTLSAFADHGTAASRLETGLDAAREVPKALMASGVSLPRVTRELTENGINAFTRDHAALLNSIERWRRDAVLAKDGNT